MEFVGEENRPVEFKLHSMPQVYTYHITVVNKEIITNAYMLKVFTFSRKWDQEFLNGTFKSN
jgi:hypothetical protein